MVLVVRKDTSRTRETQSVSECRHDARNVDVCNSGISIIHCVDIHDETSKRTSGQDSRHAPLDTSQN